MKIFRVFVLTVITILLALMIPLSLVVHSLNQTMFKPYSWNEYGTESGAYTMLHTEIKLHLAEIDDFTAGDFEQELRPIIQQTIEQIVTVEWIDAKFDEMQTNVWDYLLDQTKTVKAIQINSLKETLLVKVAEEMSKSNIPEEQSAQWMSEIKAQFPESLHFTALTSLNNDHLMTMKSVYQLFQVSNTIIIYAAGALLLVGLITAFYPVTLLRWSGYVLGLNGLLTYISYIILKIIFEQQVAAASFSGKEMNSLEQSLFEIITVMAADMVAVVAELGLILFIIGAALILASYIPLIRNADMRMRNRGTRKNPPASSTPVINPPTEQMS